MNRLLLLLAIAWPTSSAFAENPPATPTAAQPSQPEADDAPTTPTAAKPDPAAEKYWQAIKLLGSKLPAEREVGKAALQAAADLEFVHAQVQLAQCHLTGGYGFKKDERRAVNLLRLAAERGNGFAQVSLATCCVTGTGMRKDETKATEWLRKALASEADFVRPTPPADFEFAGATDDGGVVGMQTGDAASAARASAHFLLGALLAKDKKIAEAQTHYVAAAEAGPDGRDGVFQAAIVAALNYAFGQGVPRDLDKAHAMLERSRRLTARQGVNLIHNYSALKLVDEFAVADLEQDTQKASVEMETGLQLQIANQFADKKSKDYNPAEAVRWYELAADGGQAWAMLELGRIYAHHDLGQPNFEKAFHWFERAGGGARPKHYLGIANLAICYQNGLGTPKDPAKAGELFRRHRDAEFVCYLGTIGQCPATPLTYEELTALIETWARKGDAHAQYLLAIRYLNGWGVKLDQDAAEKWLKKAAKAKHGGALCLLGVIAQKRSVPDRAIPWSINIEEHRRAIEYYREGSEAGNADATAYYATMLARGGAELKKDLAAAEVAFRKCLALSPDHAYAHCNLGAIYEERLRAVLLSDSGEDAARYYRKLMFECYEKSAGLDFSYAAGNLALIYLEGRLVPKDFAQAYRYYEQAAALGSADAHYQLGEMHAQGLGVPITLTEAAYHYRLAALDGHIAALHRLADYYVDGKGVSPEPDRAIFWLSRLAAVSDDVIPKICDLMLQKGDYDGAIKLLEKLVDAPQNEISGHAYFRLSQLHSSGQGVKKNPAKAKKYFQIAIQKGDCRALTQLGMILIREKKNAEGIAMFQRAAENSPDAKFYLGQLYYFGTDVPKDETKALDYFRAAAEQNQREAMFFLAVATLNRVEGAPSLDEAIRLAAQAETLGHGKAGALRAKLEQRRKDSASPTEQTTRARAS